MSDSFDVLLLSRYGSLGASSRVRFLQFLPYFRSQGALVQVSPLFSNDYLQALYDGKPRWGQVLRGYLQRVLVLLRVKRFDIVVIEKELFPFLPGAFERLLSLLGVPYVVDYDDALFHRYDHHPNSIVRRFLGRKIDRVMRNASAVITGNNYLAERARLAGAQRVEVIPSVVDIARYQRRDKTPIDSLVVGWIGTPETSRYLEPLIPVFTALAEELGARFVAVGARETDFAETVIEVWPWSEESEVSSIQEFDVGIMPLTDSPWERGKCGFKLLQYMACAVPVVASPVGVNCRIVVAPENGLLADTPEEWENALRNILGCTVAERRRMGDTGRILVEDTYSSIVQAPRLLSVLRSTAKRFVHPKQTRQL